MPTLIYKLIAGLACAAVVEILTFRGWDHCPQIGTLFCIVWVPLNMLILGCIPRPSRFKRDNKTLPY